MAKPSTLTPAQQEEKKAAAAKAKVDNFIKLADSRVSAALEKIGLIGNLAAPAYTKTPEQVAAIKAALLDEVERTMNRFGKTEAATPTFSVLAASAPKVEAPAS